MEYAKGSTEKGKRTGEVFACCGYSNTVAVWFTTQKLILPQY